MRKERKINMIKAETVTRATVEITNAMKKLNGNVHKLNTMLREKGIYVPCVPRVTDLKLELDTNKGIRVVYGNKVIINYTNDLCQLIRDYLTMLHAKLSDSSIMEIKAVLA